MIVTQSANMNVADYCLAMERNEIVVNRQYQRSDKVWPDAAKSYLIESILLGFPIPKLYLHLITDLKNRKAIKEIVDGQQRSTAILEFYNDRFELSRSLDTDELRGLKYSTLPEDWQGRFLAHPLSIDQFVGADAKEVREVFRRMNSYTVPLNPEELRHAEHQGAFKWFIASIGTEFTDILVSMGVFTSKSVIRMQDLKLYTEIACAVDDDVKTTSRKDLDRIYKKYDTDFPRGEEFRDAVRFALGKVVEMPFLVGTDLVKPYQIYSLSIALIKERSSYRSAGNLVDPSFDSSSLESNLLDLADSLGVSDDEVSKSPYAEFVLSSRDRTNVKDQRLKRVAAFRSALQTSLIDK